MNTTPLAFIAASRAFLLSITLCLGWLGIAASAAEPAVRPRDLDALTILGPNYPHVFFFRAAEATARHAQNGFAEWDAGFSRLMGIMGKCLDEEVLGLDVRNPEFFSRFKQQHPQQVVLLHFNGNSRDPLYHTQQYSAGHWTYRKATRIVADVPAESGQSTIKVEDVHDFKVGAGRYRTSNDDIALMGITADGKHDWNHCEQVQLVSVDTKANSIVVKRGCYGTQPLRFAAGEARAAAHAVEGPWGKTNHLLWFYNYSTECPKDAQGHNCSDLLVDDLATWFGPGGKLAALDGLEFDVMFNETHGDTDGDGEVDDGVVGGVNRYGIGVVEFARKLRQRMGDRFIIQADGALGAGGIRSQRAWGLLNGIESEGWPNGNDWDFDDWSGGLNRHNFWQANARPPVFNYINHKWVEPIPGKPGEHKSAEVPFSRHRLAFAAAQFTDAAICYSSQPPRDADGQVGIWDEFRRGADNQLGWLGRPEGAAVHLAAQSPDLLAGQDLAKRIRGEVTVNDRAGQWTIAAKDAAARELTFSIADIATQGSDLVVLATWRGTPRKDYPASMGRLAHVEVSGGSVSLMGPHLEESGMAIRGKPESAITHDSGAHVTYRPRQDIGGTSLDAYMIHPPYQNGTGYVYWSRDVDVPAQAELRFSLGMGEKSPERSDGVWFQVWAAEIVDGKAAAPAKIFEKSTKAHQWIPCSVPLAAYAGKRVRLKFVADCGPHDNATTDHGLWGDVKLAIAGQPEATDTPAKAYMTWLNDRSFQSVFYFRGIKSSKLQLTFHVEGSEPVTIEKIAVYAHPDAMARVFEKGLVLANPSHAPYTFDLATISAGRKYRRLQGTAAQDTTANNGQAVSGKVTLGERDALFLIRE
jgi:hypothetical protein